MHISKIIRISSIFSFFAGTLFFCGSAIASAPVKGPISAPKTQKMVIIPKQKSEIVYSFDFSNHSDKSARKWLHKRGFSFKRAASDQSELALSFSKDALVFNAKTTLFGLMIKPFPKGLKDVKKIRITWGVEQYPHGASYEQHINNEPIMIYLYYGTKKMPSGNWFIPDAPYFIGYFLGENDKVNTPYVGRHFFKGGRFICLANPEPGKTITSEYDVNTAFKKCFKLNKTPDISGLGIEVETSSTSRQKHSLKKLNCLSKQPC